MLASPLVKGLNAVQICPSRVGAEMAVTTLPTPRCRWDPDGVCLKHSSTCVIPVYLSAPLHSHRSKMVVPNSKR